MKKSPLMAGKAALAKKSAALQAALQNAHSIVPNLKNTVQQLRVEKGHLWQALKDCSTQLLDSRDQQQVLLEDAKSTKYANIDLREKLRSAETDLWDAKREASICKTQCTQLEEALREKLRLCGLDLLDARSNVNLYESAYNQVKGDLVEAHTDIQNLTKENRNAMGYLSIASAVATFAVIAVVVLIGQLIHVS